mgnify:CR=1 FL=1
MIPYRDFVSYSAKSIEQNMTWQRLRRVETGVMFDEKGDWQILTFSGISTIITSTSFPMGITNA